MNSTLSDYFLFFTDTAPTEIYTLSLHDALPISHGGSARRGGAPPTGSAAAAHGAPPAAASPARRLPDRKSTRLNSSHSQISYAVFCLKKKIDTKHTIRCSFSIIHEFSIVRQSTC